MQNKAQGSLEFLLVIGAAILVVAVVITGLTGLLGTTADTENMQNPNTASNPLYEQLAETRGEYFIPAGTTKYYQYAGDPTNLADLAKTGTGGNVCIGTSCNDETPVTNGTPITVSGTGGNATISKTNLTPVTPEPEICDNSIDDDYDNLTDCQDPNCFNKPGCPTDYIHLGGASEEWEDCTDNEYINMDDEARHVNITELGWEIPFYDQKYSEISICGNGYFFVGPYTGTTYYNSNEWYPVAFDPNSCSWRESLIPLSAQKIIAPFYGDSIDTPTYVCYHPDHLTVRWIWGEYYERNNIADVQAQVYADGRIVFLYNNINPPTAQQISSGVSNGTGDNFTYTTFPSTDYCDPYLYPCEYPSVNSTLLRQGN